MRVPAAMIELDEAHAALHQATREQAVVRKRGPARLGAVELVDRRRSFGEIRQLGTLVCIRCASS